MPEPVIPALLTRMSSRPKRSSIQAAARADALKAAAPAHVSSVRAHLLGLLTPQQAEQLGEISELVLKHLAVAERVAGARG